MRHEYRICFIIECEVKIRIFFEMQDFHTIRKSGRLITKKRTYLIGLKKSESLFLLADIKEEESTRLCVFLSSGLMLNRIR